VHRGRLPPTVARGCQPPRCGPRSVQR
jgi:hypothetical protein